MAQAKTISGRALRMTYLDRQLLLTRRPMSARAAVRRLVALQAQYSPSPFLALTPGSQTLRSPNSKRRSEPGGSSSRR
jgi:hypothetical protein